MHHTDPRELLKKIVKTLKKLKIPYIITGGIAVFVWGRPRFTADIDIVVELHEKDVVRLEKALRLISRFSYLDTAVMLEAIRFFGEFNFIDGDTGMKVDFWVLKKHEAFDAQRLKRKKIKTILGEKINFISPEDLILIKLQWWIKSLSYKQKEDIESIVKYSGTKLDWNYLKKMAQTLGIKKNLEAFKKS